MSRRDTSHAATDPIADDVIEIWEGDSDEPEAMLRVLAVKEDHVWFKEYGKGRSTCHIKAWRARLTNAKTRKLIRPGDHDCPF